MKETQARVADELVRVRRALEQREQLGILLEGLVESISEGVVALDFRGEITHVSDPLREPSSFDAEIGGEVLPRPIQDRLRREWRKISSGRPHRFELEWEREELGRRAYEVVGLAAQPGAGTPVLTLFAFRDRTRVGELEVELERSRNLAALGQMAATVAHEIRNPLGAIQGFATLLSRDLPQEDPNQKQIERILLGVDGANRIVGDLLEYSRPLDLHLEPISIEALLGESLAVLQTSPRWGAGLDLDLSVDPGMLPCRGDRRLLLQVLANLYHNAIDAMDGRGTLSIRARGAGGPFDTDRIRLVIRDTGAGLTAEEVTRVFEPFYTSKASGTGLGLAIVRRTIEAHRGTVHIVSAPGRGTSVVLDLPAAVRIAEGDPFEEACESGLEPSGPAQREEEAA